ncbi:MAG: glycosyltransferase family 4 protein [Candidatus Izemoplasmatales bacterium]
MKVLYVTAISGTMNFFVEHIRALIAKGFNVELACNDSEKSVNRAYAEMQCPVHYIGFSRSIKSKDNITAYMEIKKLISNGNYDVVHVHTPIASVITRIACKSLKKKSIKVIYTAHGFHFFKGATIINWLVYYPIEKYLSKYTDLIITINQEDYSIATKHFKTDVVLVPGMGVNIAQYTAQKYDKASLKAELNIAQDMPVLLTIGELVPRKNQITAIRAVKKMKNDSILMIAGEGFLKDTLNNEIAKLNLQNRVFLLGYRNDVDKLYQACDIFVLPSVREGLGLVGIEAMASGKPIVATSINGILDYVEENVSGFLCKPRDSDEFAKKLDYLIDNPQIASKIGAFNVEHSKKYDIANSVKANNDIYIRLAKENS